MVYYHTSTLNFLLYVGTYCSELHKMVYLENRRYLPKESTLRAQSGGFPSEDKELRSPPAKRRYTDIRQYHQVVDEVSRM